jgi:hypothetical protein
MTNQTRIPSIFDENYWRQNYSSRPYIEKDAQYDDYQLAYKTGHEGYDRYPGMSFDEAENQLKQDYDNSQKGNTGLTWDKVKDAVRDAWDQSGTT